MIKDAWQCGELLVHLRHGVRKSKLLAEHLTNDPLVGPEARALLARLQEVVAELDIMESLKPQLRYIENDPIWSTRHLDSG